MGSTTDVDALTSCACQVPLLKTLSLCWFTDEPKCLGTPVNTSSILDNYLVQVCPGASTIFRFDHLTVCVGRLVLFSKEDGWDANEDAR